MPRSNRFVPSAHGFAFANDWPSQPAVVLATPFGDINVGDAGAGLCGGMVFAALDYWYAGAVPPTRQPAQGEALFGHLVRRLIDSWHLPAGAAQYFQWMNIPDGDSGFDAFGRRVVTERGLAWRTIKVQWPQIVADLSNGVPAALGVVTVRSNRPRDLGQNHQVLAVGHQSAGTTVTVSIYDPNRAGRDDIYIRFDTRDPTRPTRFEHNLGIGRHDVRGFFRTAYRPAALPASIPRIDLSRRPAARPRH
jgi:hypothetical protein